MGCASGKGAGPRNIFGNKYGQNLAAVQIARENRTEAKEKLEAERREQQLAQQQLQLAQQQHQQAGEDDSEGDQETDDDDEDEEEDYGPTPAAGIWAGSQKLQAETERIANPDDGEGDAETDDDDDEQPTAKKSRVE